MKRVISILFLILMGMFLIAGFTINQPGISNQVLAVEKKAAAGKPTPDKPEAVQTKNTGPESARNKEPEYKEPVYQEAAYQEPPVQKTLPEENTGALEAADGPERVIDPGKPMVALTFDDGPHPRYTLQIIDTLKKYKCAATFFVVGSRAEKYPQTIKAIAESGNQIGNHTYDHTELTKLDGKKISEEITKTAKAVYNASGSEPEVLRPSYGSINSAVRENTGLPLILWSIDTLDWKTRNTKLVVKEALKNVKDGDILLMHDIYKTTADAADTIIKELSARGYQMVTIHELYAARGIEMQKGKVYSNAWLPHAKPAPKK